MKRLSIRYLAIGLIAYLIFVIITFPADRAYALVKNKFPELTLYNVHGTLWSGYADMAVVKGKQFRALHWKVKPWTVVLGHLDVDWTFDNGSAKGRGTIGFTPAGTLQLSNVDVNMPMQELQPLLAKLPVPISGQLKVELSRAVTATQPWRPVTAEGKLSLRDASIMVARDVPLGNFQMLVDTDENGVRGVLKDMGGPLQADGILVLKNDNTYQFSGSLAVRDTTRTELVQGLSMLGRPGPNGKVAINYRGTL